MERYQVRKGDTLGSIARKFYGDASRYSLIVSANAIANPDSLKVGQTLIIPDLVAATRAVTPPAPPTPAPKAGNRTLELSEKRLGEVHPLVAARARAMIDICAHHGAAILVTQGLRSWAEQDSLYATGRTTAPLGEKYFLTSSTAGACRWWIAGSSNPRAFRQFGTG